MEYVPEIRIKHMPNFLLSGLIYNFEATTYGHDRDFLFNTSNVAREISSWLSRLDSWHLLLTIPLRYSNLGKRVLAFTLKMHGIRSILSIL